MQRLTVGHITVDAVSDGDLRLPLATVLPGADAAAFRRLGGIDNQDGMVVPMMTFVIRAGSDVILVDTGVGPDLAPMADLDAGRPVGLMPSALAAAGVTPEAVTKVVFTHLHGDHIGWNVTDHHGTPRPMFPDARYIVNRTEWANREKVAGRKSAALCLAPVEAAGQLELVDDGAVVAPGVELLPTPGHTPGHVSVLVAPAGGTTGLVITGDAAHHPGQIEAPELANVFDADPDLAVSSRKALVARAAADGLVVVGGHFPPPTAGHVDVVEGQRQWRWLGA